jgi:hypothetical protein
LASPPLSELDSLAMALLFFLIARRMRQSEKITFNVQTYFFSFLFQFFFEGQALLCPPPFLIHRALATAALFDSRGATEVQQSKEDETLRKDRLLSISQTFF